MSSFRRGKFKFPLYIDLGRGSEDVIRTMILSFTQDQSEEDRSLNDTVFLCQGEKIGAGQVKDMRLAKPIFSTRALVGLCRKVLATEFTPPEIFTGVTRMPTSNVDRRRLTEKAADARIVLFEEMAARGAAHVGQGKRAHSVLVDPKTPGAVRVSDRKNELTLCSGTGPNGEPTFWFDRDLLPLGLLMQVAAYVLSDRLVEMHDPAYFFHWLRAPENQWKVGDKVPGLAPDSSPLSFTAEMYEQFEAPVTVAPVTVVSEATSPKTRRRMPNVTPAILAERLSEPGAVLSLTQLLTEQLGNAEAAGPVARIARSALIELDRSLTESGLEPVRLTIDSVEEIPESLKAPLRAEIKGILRNTINQATDELLEKLGTGSSDTSALAKSLEAEAALNAETREKNKAFRAELNDRAEKLKEGEAAFKERVRQLEIREQLAARVPTAPSPEEIAGLAEERASLAAEQARIAAALETLATDRATLDELMSDVSSREVDLAERTAGLDHRETRFRERERELNTRDKEIAAREEALRQGLDELNKQYLVALDARIAELDGKPRTNKELAELEQLRWIATHRRRSDVVTSMATKRR